MSPPPCKVPPVGWTCSRGEGHIGPCAASPVVTYPPLTFAALRAANAERCARWHPGFPHDDQWNGADWSNAAAGEMGEACNVVKKLRRQETGGRGAADPDADVLLSKLADEIADTIIYLDLLAAYYSIDTAAAIASKFNAVSVREGWPERLP